MKLRTWHVEVAVVATTLATVVLVTRGRPIEWIAAAAVCASFMHGQVAERLAEREALRRVPQVACHAWARRYYVAKESLWLGYFLAAHAWSALVGVGLFLLYPRWRAWWRARHPLAGSASDQTLGQQ